MNRARVATAAVLTMLSACDPVRSVSGKVRSVPPAGGETNQAGPSPLAGTIVKVTCGTRTGMVFSDPQSGARVLSISRSDGTFDYADVGTWAGNCVLDFESGDGSHDSRRFAISDLCKRYAGSEECLALERITVDLVRRREPAPPVELRVRTTPANLELHTDDSVTCRTPCNVHVAQGLHRFELFEPGRPLSLWREQAHVSASTELAVQYESHRGRQLAAGWFLIPFAVGAVLLPIGLAKKDETVLWTSGALAVGGGLGFLLVWKSDRVEATVRPVLPSDR